MHIQMLVGQGSQDLHFVSGEREKCLEDEKMKENENLKHWNVGFFNEKGQDEFEYIVFGLNGVEWVFS